MRRAEVLQDAQRQLTICNACRYCEGFCAVFPALELRRAVADGDIVYLASLCHDCRACYYACMYAPPHEFAVNIPRVLADVRGETYQAHTWPGFMRFLYRDAKAAVGAVAGVMLIVTALAAWIAGPRLFMVHTGPGAFYRVIPHWVMLAVGLGLGGYWLGIWGIAGVQFWRESGSAAIPVRARDLALAAWDVLRMRWLRGGGGGCPYPTERPSHSRRVFHGLVFYGFIAAFASTTSAAIYQELLGRLPPYPLLSLPVVLGTVGGLAMIAGCVGLWHAKRGSDQEPSARASIASDYLFLSILGMTNVTGMLTLSLRETVLMGMTLAVHLGFVAALYVTAAHGKFIHAVYRTLALIRNHAEQRNSTSMRRGHVAIGGAVPTQIDPAPHE
ncbi:MAG: tricarballylate utilization 4Fe-4S protein TcuB [Armatimonadota bacterium]|nr:tricarballylate utilization 4Fe-4S protein TcuB [Armatimonadota bacterium]MDR7486146.1 tricarballylate utilization 4Fe-4S protein TcuB [Armatimonadota bacterium]MDR7531777.1 tricarballylate utilization 4Fe-4S protein TcuB [Armatimonadota bacterium]MDR7534878.1 tricarballylate utilization 4Fe-4S protein TcuB [Armatimonadota bacterium]